MKVPFVVSRRDEKRKGKNSKDLIKEVATKPGLGTGKIPAGGKGRGPVGWESPALSGNVSDAEVTNGKVGQTRLEWVLGPGTGLNAGPRSLNLIWWLTGAP